MGGRCSRRPALRRLRSPIPSAPRIVGLLAAPTGRTQQDHTNDWKPPRTHHVSPAQHDALRTYTTTLPAGSAVLVPREHLLALLGDALPAGEEKAAPLLTVAEVAKQLRVGKQTVYRLVKRKRLVASKVGRNVRVAESSLAKFIEYCEAKR